MSQDLKSCQVRVEGIICLIWQERSKNKGPPFSGLQFLNLEIMYFSAWKHTCMYAYLIFCYIEFQYGIGKCELIHDLSELVPTDMRIC